MKLKPCFALIALAASAPATLFAAEIANTNLSVTATVLDSCIVAAPTGLVFATVNTGAATNQTVQGLISVICTSAKSAVTVNLEGGDNSAAGKRYMKNTANDLLPYVITSDAGHTTPVAIDGALYSGALNAVAPNLFPVYGQVPAGSYAAGVYTDTVRVTLNY
ncbi:spore coat protein U [Cypionkella aquatica]|uniref:Spore coat protein U n=1 Tax=Cypionkella aquatica TaxID=1756042 RepID=A0AA37WZG6_9RHOB|nr:spore coat U domain-containing protein [Cypionkella aquatica]GLS86147.1 spore coat protein U [Cypionkella aquatica]